jgi:ATP-binding cassette subfamily F protein 3
MIRQQPNLLLLDEPTNHLDLEMRQALSRALVDYSGALVVISHDRHLLRSVCDELLIVHHGTVDRFELSLEEYPAWLREQQNGNSQVISSDSRPDEQGQINRKQQRQLDAEHRKKLKPLTDRVRSAETGLELHRSELHALEVKLADTALYTDIARKDELSGLIRKQAELKSAIATLEWEWLEASEALDAAV